MTWVRRAALFPGPLRGWSKSNNCKYKHLIIDWYWFYITNIPLVDALSNFLNLCCIVRWVGRYELLVWIRISFLYSFKVNSKFKNCSMTSERVKDCFKWNKIFLWRIVNGNLEWSSFLCEIIKLLNSRLVLVDFRMERLKKEVECKCIVKFTIKFAYLLFPYLSLQKVAWNGLHSLPPPFHSR